LKAKMALQMQKTPAPDIAQLGVLDWLELIRACEKLIDPIVTGRIPKVNRNTILPVAPIDLEEVVRSHRVGPPSLKLPDNAGE
jgi:hypothetical protein